MNKLFAALLILGLLVSAGARVASALEVPQDQYNSYAGGSG